MTDVLENMSRNYCKKWRIIWCYRPISYRNHIALYTWCMFHADACFTLHMWHVFHTLHVTHVSHSTRDMCFTLYTWQVFHTKCDKLCHALHMTHVSCSTYDMCFIEKCKHTNKQNVHDAYFRERPAPKWIYFPIFEPYNISKDGNFWSPLVPLRGK